MKLNEFLNPPSLIVGTFFGMIAAFIFLESQGRIKHNNNKEDFALSQYQAILIDAQSEQPYRLSPKPSNQHAACHDGYLFIKSDSNANMEGLIVDYKNRGIKCDLPAATGLK